MNWVPCSSGDAFRYCAAGGARYGIAFSRTAPKQLVFRVTKRPMTETLLGQYSIGRQFDRRDAERIRRGYRPRDPLFAISDRYRPRGP
jgi:hypothetical protein